MIQQNSGDTHPITPTQSDSFFSLMHVSHCKITVFLPKQKEYAIFVVQYNVQ